KEGVTSMGDDAPAVHLHFYKTMSHPRQFRMMCETLAVHQLPAFRAEDVLPAGSAGQVCQHEFGHITGGSAEAAGWV
ncbi:MAG: hypothetical protein WAP20_07135, partial [Limnochordia bacterium]